MGNQKKTSDYKIITTNNGNIYQFFCDLSGALCVETSPYKDADPKRELMLAWEHEGKGNFNMCHKCGIWVSDVMYGCGSLRISEG